MALTPATEKSREITLKYKIRMVIDIEGEVDGQSPLKEDTCSIYPFMQWTIEDIESKLKGICDVIDVKKVELEAVE